MKILILNSFDEQAYVEAVKDKGYYKNLKTQFNSDDIDESMEVASLNKKYDINIKRNMKEAIQFLRLPWYIISEDEIKEKTLELIVK